MELIWFEDYLALAETLNFSRAAELRHVTQPAFSRRIRALEGWIGAALFTRTTHGVALTPAGEHFHDQAEVLTRALHQLRRDTSEVSGRGVRPLSIAATHALSFTFFPKWVRGNERVLALGNLSLISDSMQACEQMMLRGDAQFLLCHHHKDASSRIYSGQFKSIVVGVDTLVPLSAPAGNGVARWRLHGGEPVKYLAYSAQSGLGRIVQPNGERKIAPLRLRRSLPRTSPRRCYRWPAPETAWPGCLGRWLKKTSRPGCWLKPAAPNLRYPSKSGCFVRSHVKARRSRRSGRPLNGVDVRSSRCARPRNDDGASTSTLPS
jgi:DNA-binding transcriptional LysR family regulator